MIILLAGCATSLRTVACSTDPNFADQVLDLARRLEIEIPQSAKDDDPETISAFLCHGDLLSKESWPIEDPAIRGRTWP